MKTRHLFFALWCSSSVHAQVGADDLVLAAIERTQSQVRYDGGYFALSYPGGDVPQNVGVCTDLVVRAYRRLGVDLQVRVHQDMRAHFNAYPSKRLWNLEKPDPNIDYRRVPNLQVFFSRKGESLPTSHHPHDYLPGDLVSWRLPGNRPHIGIVTDKMAPDTGNPLIVHNIGAGPRLEDGLFSYEITGHYRYLPK